MKREEALVIFNEYVNSVQLRKHTLAVEAGMRGYADKFQEDVEKWSVAALLHDLDYEKYPEEHPRKAVEILQRKGLSPDIIEAVKGHADYMDTPRESLMAKALYASDELASFIVACVLVRPSKSFEDLKYKSVKKKISDKAFAKGVDREMLKKRAEELGLPLEEHVKNMIEFLRLREKELQAGHETLL
jgi:putative nucleotidyltransferase with HDIG domain